MVTCPAIPSPFSMALKRSSPLFFLLGALVCVLSLALATFSPLNLCGKRAVETHELSYKRPGGCALCEVFTASVFLWFALALLLAAPSLPWVMNVREPDYEDVFGFDYATAFAQYLGCYPFDSSSTGYTCEESLGSDAVSNDRVFLSYTNNGLALGVLG